MRRMRDVPIGFTCAWVLGRGKSLLGGLTPRRMNEVVGFAAIGCGGPSVSSLPGITDGRGECAGVRTRGAAATVGGMSGGIAGDMVAPGCRNGSGVRKAGFIERLVVGCGEVVGSGVRNDGILRVCGSDASTGNGSGVRMGGGIRGGGGGGSGTGLYAAAGCGGIGIIGLGSRA